MNVMYTLLAVTCIIVWGILEVVKILINVSVNPIFHVQINAWYKKNARSGCLIIHETSK